MKYTDMVKQIYQYECTLNMEDTARIVKYSEVLNMPVPKEGVTNADIRARYAECISIAGQGEEEIDEVVEAVQELPRHEEVETEQANIEEEKSSIHIVQRIKKLSISDSKLIIVKELKKGKWDRSTYSVKNLSNGINAYLAIECNKKIGFHIDDEDVFVCEKLEMHLYSILCECPKEIENVDFFWNYYQNTLWPYLIEREEEIKHEQELMEAARQREQELRINPVFAKQLKKKVKTVKLQVVKNEELKGFDFRQIPLQEILFCNCDLTAANFTDCDMEGVIFYDCILDSINTIGSNIDKATIIKSPRDEELVY